jgi:hypothetical protein
MDPEKKIKIFRTARNLKSEESMAKEKRMTNSFNNWHFIMDLMWREERQ